MATVQYLCRGDDSTSSDIALLTIPDEADGSEANEIVYKGDSVPEPNKHFTQTKMAFTECIACAKKQTGLKIVVVFLGITIVVVVACILTLIATDKSDHLGRLKFDPNSRVMQLSNAKDEVSALEANIGKRIISKVLRRRVESTYLQYAWEEGVTLKITKNSENSFTVNWKIDPNPLDQINSFLDCFLLNNAHWYGGGQVMEQVWPLEKANIEMSSFLPRAANPVKDKNTFGSVIERYWFNSRGAAIFVNETIPLHISLNKESNGMCMQALKIDYPKSTSFELSYSLFTGNNIKDVHQSVAKKYIRKPSETPDQIMFKYPLWSTRAKLEGNLTQSSILTFASKISRTLKLNQGVFEIDSCFSSKFGDFDFDPERFPNPGAMIQQLQSYGFKVSLRISPFVNTASATFLRDVQYWVKTGDGKVPGLISWDTNNFGAVIDFTNPFACDWFKNKLKNFTKTYNFETFKFGAGEVTYLPYTYSLYKTSNNAGYYATRYAEVAAEFGKSVDVRVGYHTQHLPIFVRIHDREATWSDGNGLRSIIPTALTFGVLGYPFVLPDKIGGNPHNGTKPSKILFIRWLQLSIFLPALEFSVPPWDFDQETVDITSNMLQIRNKISSYILKMAEKVKVSGEPIVRPLWWYAPEDPVVHKIDSEFMLGDDYLVAPVLQENANEHVIYLPNGKWKKQFGDNACVNGEQYISYSNIRLEDVFYFMLSDDCL